MSMMSELRSLRVERDVLLEEDSRLNGVLRELIAQGCPPGAWESAYDEYKDNLRAIRENEVKQIDIMGASIAEHERAKNNN